MNHRQFHPFLLLLSFLLLSCAGQRPPEGGPTDTEPPRILSTTPAPFTTFFPGTSVIIEFSEYVDRGSVENAIFISPSVGPLEFEWSGREVEIRFSEQLRDSTTYLITLGTDVVDLNNRNRMTAAYRLPFSTGAAIDRGVIQGRVFPANQVDPATGIMVFAYRLDGMNVDTLNPQTLTPWYVTQTGDDGSFILSHLSFGWYRVFAVKDEFKNLLYDPETDQIGMPPSDLLLGNADTSYSDMHIQMTRADTTSPRLIKVESIDQRHIILEFSEIIDTAQVRSDYAHIADTVSGAAVKIYSFDALLPKRNLFSLVTDPLIPEMPYRVTVSGIRDLAGNAISPLASTAPFIGSSTPDTLPLKIAWISLQDSLKGVPLQPEIVINFSDVLQRESILEAALFQSEQKVSIPFSMVGLTNSAVMIKPTQPLASAAWYRFSIQLQKVAGREGKRGRDSLRLIRFQTMDRERFSSIEGQVKDSNRREQQGSLIITARDIAAKEGELVSAQATQTGRFVVNDLLEGKYSLRAFRDRNGNGRYDPGAVFPFSAAERFMQYRDTIRVRARWPMEGIYLELR